MFCFLCPLLDVKIANYLTRPVHIFFAIIFSLPLTCEDVLPSLLLSPQISHLALKAGQRGIWVKGDPEIISVIKNMKDK